MHSGLEAGGVFLFYFASHTACFTPRGRRDNVLWSLQACKVQRWSILNTICRFALFFRKIWILSILLKNVPSALEICWTERVGSCLCDSTSPFPALPFALSCNISGSRGRSPTVHRFGILPGGGERQAKGALSPDLLLRRVTPSPWRPHMLWSGKGNPVRGLCGTCVAES